MDFEITNGFTDIHTHLLPMADDGAQNEDLTMEMVNLAWSSGTRSMFMTPHINGHFKQKSTEWYREAFREICGIVHIRFPEIKLYLGSEIMYSADVPQLLSDGKLLTMNDSEYVLLELQMGMSERSIVNAVYETVRNGFIPILAHVDRFEVFRKNYSLADKVIDNGALIQINVGSVVGKSGPFVKRYCRKLLEDDKVNFISSDAHNTETRPPILLDGYKSVAKKYGVNTANRLFSQNAQILFQKGAE